MSKYHVPSTSEIKNSRLRAELSQADCADMCCVTNNTWSRWEKGQYPMPAGMWKLYNIELARLEQNKVNEVSTDADVVHIDDIRKDWTD